VAQGANEVFVHAEQKPFSSVSGAVTASSTGSDQEDCTYDVCLSKTPNETLGNPEKSSSRNTDVLKRHFQQVVARRNAATTMIVSSNGTGQFPNTDKQGLEMSKYRAALKEVQKIISLPQYHSSITKSQQDPATAPLSEKVLSQLEDYIRSANVS
jgi:hypothetical protein